MKIRDDKTGRVLVTRCRGCMCHDMAMIFGTHDTCDECGCPHTLDAYNRMYAEQESKAEPTSQEPTR